MNSNVENRISQLLENGFKIDLNRVFGDITKNLKGVVGYAFLALFIYFIASWLISSVIGLFIPVVAIDQEELENVMIGGGDMWEYYRTNLLTTEMGISSFLTNIISAVLYPIIYSIYNMTYKYERAQQIEFEDLFVHYKNGKFIPLFLATIIIQLITSLALLLCVFPVFVVSGMCLLAVPLIIFADADLGKALSYSFKLATKDLMSFVLVVLGIFGIGILSIIVGAILCCVGLIVTIPLFYIIVPIIIYSLYKEVIGFPDHRSEIEEIGTDIYKNNPYMNQ